MAQKMVLNGTRDKQKKTGSMKSAMLFHPQHGWISSQVSDTQALENYPWPDALSAPTMFRKGPNGPIVGPVQKRRKIEEATAEKSSQKAPANFTVFKDSLSNSIQSDTAPTCSPVSSNASIIQWWTAYEKRQADRDALLCTKIDHIEEALASLSMQLTHDHQSAESLGADSSQQSTDEDCTQAEGPSAQSLIEQGVCNGWPEYASRNGG